MQRGDVILVATGNPGKVREVAHVLSELGLAFETLERYPDLPEAIEDGDTFAANAAIKATHYSRLTGRLTLADDSGLEIDALGGEPGVHSARYAGPQRDDAANNTRMIAELQGVPDKERSARFRCAMALADGDRILAESAGTIEGRIIDQPRGANGFGYDPHFVVPSLGVTMAELPMGQKNQISHRGQALRAIAEKIADIARASEPRA